MSKYVTNENRTLVIVESPAKCKKIEEYLGPGYKVMACYGHLRELSSLADVDENYNPTFREVKGLSKQKQIRTIREAIPEYNDIILATDDDREGEAIAWHLADMFHLSVDTTKRIKFHEITKDAIANALKKPQKINMNVVNAQKTRQILDLLIGYKITPVLWRSFSRNYEKSLSAGRCQTPTLRLIYDNELERKMGVPYRYYDTIGYFSNKCIPFTLNKSFIGGEECVKFLGSSASFQHILQKEDIQQQSKRAPAPLSTSRLQQLASNELNMSPTETMKICQSLYENGYITYMRTDSKEYSIDFIEKAKEYILKIYEKVYIRKDYTDLIKTNESEAHEAIRPTNVFLSTFDKEENKKEKRMYELIWNHTMECCLSDSIYQTISCHIKAVDNNSFKHVCEKNIFAGWEILRKKKHPKDTLFEYIQNLKNGVEIFSQSIDCRENLKKQTHYYTEARLIQLLEQKGIGRPSTYATLVEKIKERGYVKKENVNGEKLECSDYHLEGGLTSVHMESRVIGNEKNKLIITPLGTLIIEFLLTKFRTIFEYEYTKEIEFKLDEISKGFGDGKSLCKDCDIYIAVTSQVDISTDRIQFRVDENHTFLISKYGPVLKKTVGDHIEFISVKSEIDIEKLKRNEYILDDLIKEKDERADTHHISLGVYKDKEVHLGSGRYGMYAKWSNKNISLKTFGNRPIENIKLEEIIVFLENSEKTGIVRIINDTMSLRCGNNGEYIYYKAKNLKKPKFFHFNGFEEDSRTCELSIIKSWIRNTHKMSCD